MMFEYINLNLMGRSIDAQGLVVTGKSGHGKDTLCEHLYRIKGVKSAGSSWVAMEAIVFRKLQEMGFDYSSKQQCFDDRVNHRKLWYDLIAEWVASSPCILGATIAKDHHVYNGLRSKVEWENLKKAGLYHTMIWVDSDERMGYVEDEAMTLRREDADIIITNNGDMKSFFTKAVSLAELMVFK